MVQNVAILVVYRRFPESHRYSIVADPLSEPIGILLWSCRRPAYAIDLRLLFAYPAPMGEMRRAIAREQEERRTQDRFASTLVIAASIIAAVRLAREDISTPSQRLLSTVGDSVSLARMILKRVAGS
jgi:hypothetical protein